MTQISVIPAERAGLFGPASESRNPVTTAVRAFTSAGVTGFPARASPGISAFTRVFRRVLAGHAWPGRHGHGALRPRSIYWRTNPKHVRYNPSAHRRPSASA